MRDKAGKCTVDVEPLINEFFTKLPESITSSYSFRSVKTALESTSTWPGDGNSCPLWEGRP
jgi:hypothetical protein